MTERERLIELLKKLGNEENDGINAESIANYLLENGVIVPPVRVGNIAYFVLYDGVDDEWFISEEPIVDVCTKGFYTSGKNGSTENCDLWLWSCVGDDTFFDKEEAEQALKEKGK